MEWPGCKLVRVMYLFNFEVFFGKWPIDGKIFENPLYIFRGNMYSLAVAEFGKNQPSEIWRNIVWFWRKTSWSGFVWAAISAYNKCWNYKVWYTRNKDCEVSRYCFPHFPSPHFQCQLHCHSVSVTVTDSVSVNVVNWVKLTAGCVISSWRTTAVRGETGGW